MLRRLWLDKFERLEFEALRDQSKHSVCFVSVLQEKQHFTLDGTACSLLAVSYVNHKGAKR